MRFGFIILIAAILTLTTEATVAAEKIDCTIIYKKWAVVFNKMDKNNTKYVTITEFN